MANCGCIDICMHNVECLCGGHFFFKWQKKFQFYLK